MEELERWQGFLGFQIITLEKLTNSLSRSRTNKKGNTQTKYFHLEETDATMLQGYGKANLGISVVCVTTDKTHMVSRDLYTYNRLFP